MAKKQESPIYSKINYENAVEIKKNMLGIQAGLLKTYKAMEDYKTARKKEYIHKVKLKKDLKETKKLFTKLIDSVPETKGIKDARKEIKQKHEEAPTTKKKSGKNIQAQLEDIRQRLQELA